MKPSGGFLPSSKSVNLVLDGVVRYATLKTTALYPRQFLTTMLAFFAWGQCEVVSPHVSTVHPHENTHAGDNILACKRTGPRDVLGVCGLFRRPYALGSFYYITTWCGVVLCERRECCLVWVLSCAICGTCCLSRVGTKQEVLRICLCRRGTNRRPMTLFLPKTFWE